MDRKRRFEIQNMIITKGGFHFLIFLFNTVDKETDLEKDTLNSKVLQNLMSLLNLVHSNKLLHTLNLIAKPKHTQDMITGTLTIIHSFFDYLLKEQSNKQD